MAVVGGGGEGGDNNGDDADGGRRQASENPSHHLRPRVAAVLPGLANAPREAALEERGFVLDGLAEFWAAAAAAAKVARFCNCRALIPGGRGAREGGVKPGQRGSGVAGPGSVPPPPAPRLFFCVVFYVCLPL